MLEPTVETFLSELPLEELTFEFRRNELLTRIDEHESYLYYILSGAVIAYIEAEESEQVIRLGYSGNIINALPSFLSGRPSDIGIRAIRAGKAVRVPKHLFKDLIASSSDHRITYTKLLEELFIRQTEREFDLLTNSPAERLTRVLKRSPSLFQEIPAKYIASYLRMSPETLSRIK